jgi:CDP-diacylglycerol pyrophosphatase
MIGMRTTVKTEQLLQDGGTPDYMNHDRTAWHCAFFVSKRYGSKGHPQRNAAHVR